MIIFITAFTGSLFNKPGNPHLSFQLSPEKDQACAWIFFELLSFEAVIVRKEDKAFLIKSFKQDYSRRGKAFGLCCGKRHWVRFINRCIYGIIPPSRELFDGILMNVMFG